MDQEDLRQGCPDTFKRQIHYVPEGNFFASLDQTQPKLGSWVIGMTGEYEIYHGQRIKGAVTVMDFMKLEHSEQGGVYELCD